MLKVLRKYNKWFLAVGGTLLLITFLFTNTAELFRPDPTKRVVASVGGAKIIAAKFDEAQRDFEALKEFAPITVRYELSITDPTHWMLLAREAERAGLIGDSGDGLEWIPELAENEARMLAYVEMQRGNYGPMLNQAALIENYQSALPAQRASIAARARLTEAEFDQLLAQLRGVRRLVTLYAGAPRFSDRRGLAEARKVYDGVLADVLVVPADRLTATMPEPTPEAIQAHYDAFRSVRPGEGEHGFGYIQPARVKLEWMQLPIEDIRKAIQLDPLDVSRFYQLNRAQYPGEFAAEKSKIEVLLREEKVKDILTQFDSIYKARLRALARRFENDGAVKKLPADWNIQRPKMESLAADVVQALRDATGVPIPMPNVIERSAQWTRLDQFATTPGLGAASYNVGGQRGAVPIAAVIAAVHELNPESSVGLQVGFPWENFVTDNSGNRYYFTILDAKATGEPGSLDEVRDQVVADLKRKAAYDTLAADTATVLASAVTGGLAEVAKTFEVKDADGKVLHAAPEVARDIRISRNDAGRFPQINDPAFREKVMDTLAALTNYTGPTPENAPDRTVVMPLPKSLSLVAAQLTYPQPMTVEDARTMSRGTYQTLLREEVENATETVVSPFSLEQLKARLEYKDLSGKEPATAPQ